MLGFSLKTKPDPRTVEIETASVPSLTCYCRGGGLAPNPSRGALQTGVRFEDLIDLGPCMKCLGKPSISGVESGIFCWIPAQLELKMHVLVPMGESSLGSDPHAMFTLGGQYR